MLKRGPSVQLCRVCRRSYATATSAWKTTVGLELHAQLATPLKLFSQARQRFAGPANQDIEPFDIALPGSMPHLNTHAVLLAVRAALALQCQVNMSSTFDRKHYIYPDQPAGYQITQHYNALAHAGLIHLSSRDESSLQQEIDVTILQIQLEQDTAKTLYFEAHDAADPSSTDEILVDANRSGSALIEIVTGPALPSGRAAAACLRKIQAILKAIGASDASMDTGALRCDVNVSVAHQDQTTPSQRVEIKNLASARAVMNAVDAEARRQIEELERGGIIASETRGYDVAGGITFKIRDKETTTDYRYMPESDLPPIALDDIFLATCRKHLAELPDAVLDRLTAKPFSLQLRDVRVLEADRNLLGVYEDVLSTAQTRLANKVDKKAMDKLPRTVAAWLVHDLVGRQNIIRETQPEASTGDLMPTTKQLADLIISVIAGDITRQSGQQVLSMLLSQFQASQSVQSLVEQHGLALAQGDGASAASHALVKEALKQIMQQNPAQTAKLHGGDPKIVNWFLGQVLRRIKGSSAVKDVEAIIIKEQQFK
ncbi:GatB/GatE catalytic domain-domain-containing protein [Protomyces lactucae-debilis]|uniref:Glutamyl-tRNA(Gln) amidotransferase subunit B, mitochondrial n=1 Tax=Protomyces lactucae-debilis TaxID=2754530 RepID=A0A1Y2EYT8_PROLT|nr:GatB/GatE catalytic domain-containing protein [Protomyces lactucae-debilis]ORY76657.1 GatB/GatE catalytic domain-domain-containing protein [Protomyces lactucae-debilis]